VDSARERGFRPDRPLPGGRRAWLAFSLGLLCPGWGHLYAGAAARGLAASAFTLAALLPGLLWLWQAGARGPLSTLAVFAASGAAALALPLDAARLAVRRPPRRPRARRVLLLHGLFVPLVVIALHRELSYLRAHRARLFRTPTESMVPTLLPGDVFLVDARDRTRAALAPGDVIVFEDPHAPGTAYAKRLVARAGSRVALRGARLEVDGRPVTGGGTEARASLLSEELGGTRYRVAVGSPGELPDFGPVVVPEGHVFVLGDARARSRDSRVFGPVPVSRVRGRALRVLWSFDPARGRVRWSRLGLPLAGSER
jgi:signal peptidase I